MVNSWLWQTDMKGPATSAATEQQADSETGPLFRTSSEADAKDAFPYPRLGNGSKRSFREMVKEQRVRDHNF